MSMSMPMSLQAYTMELNNDSIIINDDNVKASQPQHIKQPLKQHQLSLIHQCKLLENSCNINLHYDNKIISSKMGIIGDIVGSGKTLSVLSIISQQKCITNMLPNITSNSLCVIEQQQEISSFSSYNLIIVPHTVYKQWATTIENYTNFKYYGIYNNKSLNSFLEIFDNTKNNDLYKTFNENQIILITNTKYNELFMMKQIVLKFLLVVFYNMDLCGLLLLHIKHY